MNQKEAAGHKKKLLLIFPFLLILLIARFVFHYITSDGYSGVAGIIPFFMLAGIVFFFLTSLSFALWVYEDCRKRKEDPVLWAVIVFLITPFIGLLVYFLRRPEPKKECISCGQQISLQANYCEHCGTKSEERGNVKMEKQTHHLNYLILGIVCMVLFFTCLTGFVVNAAVGDHWNTSVTSDDKVWNKGTILMNYDVEKDGIWKLDFRRASDGFVKQSNMQITDPDVQQLYADINCDTVPDGAALTLWLVQGDQSESVDVTKLEEPIRYSLENFEKGEIHIRLEIRGVKDVTSEISIQ